MSRVTRRQLLLAGAASGLAAAAYPTLLEPRWLDLTHTRISLGTISLDTEDTPVRILHLSDLHASWAVPISMIEAAIQSGLSANPDLICLTGDFITHRYEEFGHYAAVLRRLSQARPAFAILGNHDGGIWAQTRGYPDHSLVDRLLEDAGITLLHNRAQHVQARGTQFTLVGVGDVWSNELDPAHAFRDVRGTGRVVLMSHNPDTKDVLARFPWDLLLCGHTHGGQVIVPFEGPEYAPVVDKRFIAGLYEWSGRRIYITRGVGNVGGVRFRCRPEVSILDVALG